MQIYFSRVLSVLALFLVSVCNAYPGSDLSLVLAPDLEDLFQWEEGGISLEEDVFEEFAFDGGDGDDEGGLSAPQHDTSSGFISDYFIIDLCDFYDRFRSTVVQAQYNLLKRERPRLFILYCSLKSDLLFQA